DRTGHRLICVRPHLWLVREPVTGDFQAYQSVKKRILLADDDHAVLESLGHVLASENYEVALARTGHEALGKFLTGRADLGLLDLNMPNQDGWRTFDLIETLAPLLPVIIITARPNQYGRAAALRIDALMEKPLDLPLF